MKATAPMDRMTALRLIKRIRKDEPSVSKVTICGYEKKPKLYDNKYFYLIVEVAGIPQPFEVGSEEGWKELFDWLVKQ